MKKTNIKIICRFTTLLLGILFWPGHTSAAPSGEDLIQACKQSLQNGFDSMIGEACTWYVTPCDCDVNSTLPKVCLPADAATPALASLVIDGLTEHPELRKLDAAEAAAIILSRHYPCSYGAPEQKSGSG